jgi:Protein of unknown function (DUF3288)
MSERLEEILGAQGAEAAKKSAAILKQETGGKDQQHPQASRDRQTCEQLLKEGMNDFNLAELARLRVRYAGFPGARDIQARLAEILDAWNLTEAELFAKTREIHDQAQVYRVSSNKREDWN